MIEHALLDRIRNLGEREELPARGHLVVWVGSESGKKTVLVTTSVLRVSLCLPFLGRPFPFSCEAPQEETVVRRTPNAEKGPAAPPS